MEIQQLYYYMELCRQKNFTEAGYSCNMTQGALSKQIRKLENELGTTLIRRNTRRFELSKEGEIFLSYAKEMTSMYEEMLKNIQKNKEIKIGCTCTISFCKNGSRFQKTISGYKNGDRRKDCK